jgi:hypothetical protein
MMIVRILLLLGQHLIATEAGREKKEKIDFHG